MLTRLKDKIGAWLFDHTSLSATWVFNSKMNQIEEEYGMERGSFGEFLKAWMEERKDNGEAE